MPETRNNQSLKYCQLSPAVIGICRALTFLTWESFVSMANGWADDGSFEQPPSPLALLPATLNCYDRCSHPEGGADSSLCVRSAAPLALICVYVCVWTDGAGEGQTNNDRYGFSFIFCTPCPQKLLSGTSPSSDRWVTAREKTSNPQAPFKRKTKKLFSSSVRSTMSGLQLACIDHVQGLWFVPRAPRSPGVLNSPPGILINASFSYWCKRGDRRGGRGKCWVQNVDKLAVMLAL